MCRVRGYDSFISAFSIFMKTGVMVFGLNPMRVFSSFSSTVFYSGRQVYWYGSVVPFAYFSLLLAWRIVDMSRNE